MHTLCICEISYGYARQNAYSCEGIEMRRYRNARMPRGLSHNALDATQMHSLMPCLTRTPSLEHGTAGGDEEAGGRC